MHKKKSELLAFEMLTARSRFLTVQGKGKKWVSHGLALQILENETDDKIRTGYTVTKKIEKLAVKRNRVKRRLRSVAADVLSEHAKPGVDYILVGRRLTATRSYEELCRDLRWCLKKTGYFQELEKVK